MKKYKLGDILELQRGYDLPLSQQKTGNVLVAGSNGIIGSHNEARSNHPCITVGRSGSVGKVHYYEQPTWAHNTTLFVKDFKGNSPRYLYYFLKNLHLDKMFAKGSSVVPSLDRNVVHSLVVPFPKDIVFQQRIASVLSNLDRKITLNRSINHNLEAMAKQLYDYWFVQFDFPDENGMPYKSSGGKMVWNEKLKREIPEGWNVVLLSQYLETYVEKVSTTSINPNDRYAPIEVIPRRKMSFWECSPIENAVSGLCRFQRKHILLSNRRVYFHKVCIAAFSGLTRDTVIVLKPTSEDLLGYAYQLVNDDMFIEYATRHSYGSEQPVLSWESAKSYKALKPSNRLDATYSEFIVAVIEDILRNEMEIDALTKLRDSLLPLLMNCQVSVNYDLSNDWFLSSRKFLLYMM